MEKVGTGRALILAALGGLIVAAGFVAVAPATAASTDDDVAFARQVRGNCVLQVTYATTAAETARAQACIEIQDKVIAGLTAPPPPTSAAPPPPPPPSGFPTAASTGYRDGVALTATSCTLNTANAVYEHRLFNCGSATGALIVNAANVTIRQSVINAGVGTWGGVQVHGSATIVDTTIQAAGSPFAREAAVGGHDFTLTRVKVLSGVDGVNPEGSNILVEDSYVETHPAGGAHSDGIQPLADGTNIRVLHNTITQRGTPSTSPIFLSGYPSPAWIIQGNLLVGGAYTLRIGGASGAGSQVTGNVIARDEWMAGTGATLVENPCTAAHNITWSGNELGDVSADYATVSNRTSLTLAC